ncbi:MAG: TerC family protein [Alphaproteobacteria bacterium]|nr:TerC family protein [Alphaproteobacteria bacterium]
MVSQLYDARFWTGLVQIIIIDILLSGDNAVVIALAVRSLPAHQRRKGIIFGTGAAILLRVIFAAFVVYLLEVPYLKLIGGVLLLWIAVKLMLPEHAEGEGDMAAATNVAQAIRLIVVADAVMSLDNVVAIAAAAHGSVLLLVLGLLISIPLIIYGSTLILGLVDRYPIIVAGGAALLGWIAGHIIVTDPAVVRWVGEVPVWGDYALRVVCAILVIVIARVMLRLRRSRPKSHRPVVDLAAKDGADGRR